jgi:uncharacterized membrane protein
MRSDATTAEKSEAAIVRRAIRLTALAALLFLAGSYLAPVLEAAGWEGSGLLRLPYSPVCHQIPERSFQFFGAAQAVCARCAGLYWGGVTGLVAASWLVVGRRFSPRPAWLAWALAPTLLDAALPWIGLRGLSTLPRHLLAWPVGFVAGLFLAVGIADLASRFTSERSREAGGLRADSLLEGSDG